MTAERKPYPWQKTDWRRLRAYQTQDRLPQALLLTGPRGIGKSRLALYFAQNLLCESRNACGTCHSCALLAADNHPDLVTLAPEQGKDIPVDSIRNLIQAMALTPHYGRRVIIIESAERMSNAAANSFLKTLEEPNPENLILLLSEMPTRLPATIRSRCQQIKLSLPEREQTVQWLCDQGFTTAQAELAIAIQHGSPLLARVWLESDLPEQRQRFLECWQSLLEARQDPVLLAANWKDEDYESVLAWLMALCVDLIRLAAGSERVCLNLDQEVLLQKQARRLNLKRLLDYWQGLLAAKAECRSQINRQLALESLFLETYRLKS